MVEMYSMFQALYAQLGDQRSEQFNWQIGRMEGRHNVPTQENLFKSIQKDTNSFWFIINYKSDHNTNCKV
jgi:hypothetical protein